MLHPSHIMLFFNTPSPLFNLSTQYPPSPLLSLFTPSHYSPPFTPVVSTESLNRHFPPLSFPLSIHPSSLSLFIPFTPVVSTESLDRRFPQKYALMSLQCRWIVRRSPRHRCGQRRVDLLFEYWKYPYPQLVEV